MTSKFCGQRGIFAKVLTGQGEGSLFQTLMCYCTVWRWASGSPHPTPTVYLMVPLPFLGGQEEPSIKTRMVIGKQPLLFSLGRGWGRRSLHLLLIHIPPGCPRWEIKNYLIKTKQNKPALLASQGFLLHLHQ